MLELKFDTGNAAFDNGDFGAECARILRELADLIEDCGRSESGGTIADINGNRIGSWSLE